MSSLVTNSDRKPLKVWLPAIRTGSGTDIFTLRLAEGLRSNGIEVVLSWFPHFFEFFPKLLRRVKPPEGTNLIHANSWHAIGFWRQDIPLVVTVHHVVFDPEYSRTKTWKRWLYHELIIKRHEHQAFMQANAITAVSHFASNCAIAFNNAPSVRTISNWVDTEQFRPADNKKASDTQFKLLFVGNPTHHKGADLLAPIMEHLGTEFILHYTSNPKIKYLKAKTNNIHALGRLNQAEIVRALQECDALLLPTRGEAAPLVVLEAMACGKPVITSRNTALIEYVEDGVSGILCETGNINEFVNTLKKLKDNTTLVQNMGEAARERVLERFSATLSIHAYMEIYRDVIV